MLRNGQCWLCITHSVLNFGTFPHLAGSFLANSRHALVWFFLSNGCFLATLPYMPVYAQLLIWLTSVLSLHTQLCSSFKVIVGLLVSPFTSFLLAARTVNFEFYAVPWWYDATFISSLLIQQCRLGYPNIHRLFQICAYILLFL